MRPYSLFKTSTFRLTLIYMIIFGGFALIMVTVFYSTAVNYIAQQTDKTIEAEVLGLAEANLSSGARNGVRSIIELRSQTPTDGSLYLLTKDDLSPLAGNLPAWPDHSTPKNGWVTFEYEKNLEGQSGSETRKARGRIFTLASTGQKLMVARDIEERLLMEKYLTQAYFTASAFIILVGFTAGVVISKQFLRRIDLINSTSRQIIAGKLNQRVPVEERDDEINQLAHNLNAMLDQIERLMTGMREVTDNVAHDLRSPLNRLRNRLEVTLMTPASVEEYQSALEASIKDADNLLNTFNALLSIASVEAGSIRDSMSRVCAADVVRDVAELYEPVAESKDVSFSLRVNGEGTVWGNRELLSQAMANLMDNAIKYSPDGGAVDVVLNAPDEAGGVAEFSVSDTGPGIPSSDRKRVLNRFVRLEASRNTPGSGLGLSLVSAVARMHDGSLDLGDSVLKKEPQADHPGLKIVLRLPTIA